MQEMDKGQIGILYDWGGHVLPKKLKIKKNYGCAFELKNLSLNAKPI
jgi:hypothetical protein